MLFRSMIKMFENYKYGILIVGIPIFIYYNKDIGIWLGSKLVDIYSYCEFYCKKYLGYNRKPIKDDKLIVGHTFEWTDKLTNYSYICRIMENNDRQCCKLIKSKNQEEKQPIVPFDSWMFLSLSVIIDGIPTDIQLYNSVTKVNWNTVGHTIDRHFIQHMLHREKPIKKYRLEYMTDIDYSLQKTHENPIIELDAEGPIIKYM